MPLSGRNLRGSRLGWLVVIGAFWSVLCGAPVPASEGEPLHTSGDRQLWHRKDNVVELFGHAVVSQPGETLTADYVRMDLSSRVLDAKGSCVYISAGNVIYGDEMHFNLETRTGTVVGGRVSNLKFTLSGERINKLGDGRFQTHWGEYSTCVDCPNSWSLLAEDVDMQVDGYAFMSNVTSKISDTPAFWFPYLIVPMKTRRQTGFLFPELTVNSLNGLELVLPFYWAISRSADMTIGAGTYSSRGPRVEWEGRYQLSPRSGGKANLYYLYDTSFTDANATKLPPSRFALDVAQTQELPWGLTEKIRLTEVSDNLYPIKIGDPIPGGGELTLPSNASLSYASSDVSGFVALRRYRNLIDTVPDAALAVTEFDPHTVQEYPSASIIANDRQLFHLPVVAGLSMGFVNFTRSGDAYDLDYYRTHLAPTPNLGTSFESGTDPLRKATRLSVTPSLYATFRPFDVFTVIPTLRYYYYWYTFPQSQQVAVPNLNRGYLLFQTDLSTQLERIYDYPDDRDHPRVKHLIRPLMTFSYIPPEFQKEDTTHPFLQQIQNATAHGLAGYNFDDYDIVPTDNSPLTSNYFIPLGYSINTGLTMQWIRRNGNLDSPNPTYLKYIEASAGEAINLREFEKGNDIDANGNVIGPHIPQPLSRFFTTLDLNLGRFTYSHLYYYYPYVPGPRHALSQTINYALSRGMHQGLFTYDRSISLTYAWDQHGLAQPAGFGTDSLTLSGAYSLSDYLLPTAFISYDFVGHQFLSGGAQVQFQSPSRCWKLTASANYNINVKDPNSTSLLNGYNFNLDLALNISGTGYGGVSEVANQAVAPK